jgi:hypothetical protein
LQYDPCGRLTQKVYAIPEGTSCYEGTQRYPYGLCFDSRLPILEPFSENVADVDFVSVRERVDLTKCVVLVQTPLKKVREGMLYYSTVLPAGSKVEYDPHYANRPFLSLLKVSSNYCPNGRVGTKLQNRHS